jgi:hypothetical protein
MDFEKKFDTINCLYQFENEVELHVSFAKGFLFSII